MLVSTPRVPKRSIIQAEAIGWLSENPAIAGASVITSLPDVSEMSELDFEAWRAWFIEAARVVIAWTPETGVTIFYQSDVRHGPMWVDKGYLVSRAAEDAGAILLWHKIVCRKPAGSLGHGRATYSHMLAFTRSAQKVPLTAPDVLPSAGLMPWSKAMGVAACVAACSFVQNETSTQVIVDPFCGGGTALAVANAMGFDAIGVDRSARRCRLAKKLEVTLSSDQRA